MNLSRTWDRHQHHRARMRLYKQFIQAGDLVFDAGANTGSRTMIFAELGARVIAIEPQKECVRQLYIRFRENPRVTIVPKALGAAVGAQDMQLSNLTQTGSLNPDLVHAEHGDPRWKIATWDNTRRVPVTTLDTLIAEYGVPSFVKLDIEGYEAQALGALSRPLRALSFEFVPVYLTSARESIARLEQLGGARYNYAVMEDMQLLLDEWVNGDEMLRILSSLEHTDKFLYGDVYARMKVQ